MSVQDSSDKTTSPPTIPLFIHENTILKGSSRLDGIDSTIWAQASVASILFFIYTTSPQESYESQLERRWDLKVVLLRTQLRLNAPRHFGMVSLRWPLAFTSPRPLSATINSLMQILFVTDRRYWRERERGENCRLYGSRSRTNRHVEISVEIRGSSLFLFPWCK